MARKRSKNKKYFASSIAIFLCVIYAVFFGYMNENNDSKNTTKNEILDSNIGNENTVENNSGSTNLDLSNIPEFDGKNYTIKINDNVPYFEKEELITEVFEKYSKLNENDPLDRRCGVAYANICKEIMPKEDEERTGQKTEPTGWIQNVYTNDKGKQAYLYNRCHLIAWSLADENDNELNLITGTVKLNSEMKEKELEIINYIKENQKNHVLYRVTPVFEGENLVASGVEMEAYSVEDDGQGICFNVYCYNVQDGFTIDYATRTKYI